MLECDVVRDLLPLYTENMVSPRSAELIVEHLQRCPACSQAHAAMMQPQPNVAFRIDSAQQFAAYQKNNRRKLCRKIVLICAIIMGILMTIIGCVLLATGLIMFTSLGDLKPDIDTDPVHYSQYFGEKAEEAYRSKWGMDETIMPPALTDSMQVQDFKMIYYNDWDAQYVSYLTVTYSPADYQKECERLASCGIDEYKGIYGVTGFDGGDPLAIEADAYQGFVYAINTPEKENTITYCELIFCNYFLDVNYTEEVPAAYLPNGFDATPSNPYRAKMMRQDRVEYLADHEEETDMIE